jgi:hypothetical protein
MTDPELANRILTQGKAIDHAIEPWAHRAERPV